jgi:hypothetical protein
VGKKEDDYKRRKIVSEQLSSDLESSGVVVHNGENIKRADKIGPGVLSQNGLVVWKRKRRGGEREGEGKETRGRKIDLKQ